MASWREMAESNLGPGIDSFVAIGDSFTEGLRDTYPDGGYRGSGLLT
jgi:hypothetical protein